jgi:tRNA-splicing ligase RtcB
MATRGVVVPNAVGSDIGCGVVACKTPLKGISREQLIKVLGGGSRNKEGIRSSIPVGMKHHKADQLWPEFDNAPDIFSVQQQISSARKQLGTLGGGNHFIEIQEDETGYVWIMLHSGSRNFGYKIAQHYNNLAQALTTRWYSNIPQFKGDDGLAFLPLDTSTTHAPLLRLADNI